MSLRRVYRTKNSVRTFWFVLLAFSLFFCFGAWKAITVGTNTWVDLAIAAVLIVVGGYGAIRDFTIRVVLSEDSISQGSIFRSESIRFDQIRYRREYMEYHDSPEGGINVYYLDIVSSDSDVQSLKISKDDFNFDRTFWDWVFRIPDIERL